MTNRHTFTPARIRSAIAGGAVAALATTIAVAPAYAAEGCESIVTDAAEYVAAVECASASDAAHTITLGADIVLGADQRGNFEGNADLTLDGAGYTISDTGTDDPTIQPWGMFLSVASDDETAHVTIANLTVEGFAESHALGVYGAEGLTIDNTTFIDNGTAAVSSGAIDTRVPTTISNSTFTGNDGRYGGIVVSTQSLRIANSTISNNSASHTLVETQGTLELVSSTVANNITEFDSVVYNSHSNTKAHVLVENSTVIGNEGAYGTVAAYAENGGPVTVRHSTFADNTTADASHLTIRSAQATLEGNAFVGAAEVPNCDIELAADTSYNFDGDGSCTGDWSGTGDIGDGLDAQLGALAANGGATQTLLPVEGSVLVDAIPADADVAVSADQRGIARPQGEGYDIGAVEVKVVEKDEDTTDGGDSDGGDSDGSGDGDTVTFQVKTDGGTISGSVSPAVAVTDIDWTATGDLTGAPADTALPYGAAGFTVEVAEPGESVTVTLTAPAPFTAAYKVTDGTWSSIDGATFSADRTQVSYTLTDGGELDEDGEANGFIVDPVALAVQATFAG